MSNDLTLKTPLEELEKNILEEENIDDLNNIIDLFNLNLKKKDIIRSSKLNELQDNIVQEIGVRIENPYAITDKDLLGYFKAIQETITKSDNNLENVKIPTIQLNQRININKAEFNSESRKKILAAVNNIMSNIENSEDIKELLSDVKDIDSE